MRPMIPRSCLVGVFACLPLMGGCVFGEPEKRGSVVDELEIETDLALRTLDGADTAGAIPTLSALADAAGRADEIGLRIQTLLLTARTLDGEATLWPADKAAGLRRGAVRHADLALEEAEDWLRFEPGAEEAALLAHDARILRARLSPDGDGGLEQLLAAAIAEAVSRGDMARTTAWRIALCGAQLDAGRPDSARSTLAGARSSFARVARTAGRDDPAAGALLLALTEAEGDAALHDGRTEAAAGFFGKALGMARGLRRRDELRRVLLKLSLTAERSGDGERSAWYRRRTDGVARTPASPGPSPAKPPPGKKP